jgi:hypothetical protein
MAQAQSEYLIQIQLVDGQAQAKLNGVTVSLSQIDKELKNIKTSSTGTSAGLNKISTAAKGTTKANQDLISSSGLAGATLVETGRFISDLPFGITAVTNNLSQLSTLFITLASKTKGAGKAFKLLGKQLMGPLGFILIFQVVISLIQVYQKEIIGFIKGTDEGRRAAEAFARALKQKGGFIAELKIAEQVMKDNKEGSEAYQGALAKLKKNGFDPATESVDEFIKKQFELAIIQAEMEQFTERESKRRTEEQKILADITQKEEYLAKLKTQGVKDLVQEYEVGKLKERIEEINAASAADIEGISSRAAIAFKDVASDVSKGRPSKLKSIFGFSLPSSDELEEIMNEAKNQLQKITDSMREKKEELDAEDEFARIELRRTRAIADIEAITNNEVAKREAILATNAYYDSLEEDARKKKLAKDKATDDAKEKLSDKDRSRRNEDLRALSGQLDKGAALFGEQTVANKSMRVASATMDTYAAADTALATLPPPLSFIAAAATIAAGIANVKGILSVKVPGGKGGGVSAPPAPPSSMQAPDFNVVGATAQSQLAQTIAGSESKPVRAFVVGKDVTTQQELDRNRRRTSALG